MVNKLQLSSITESELLQAALIGLEHQRMEIDTRIQMIKGALSPANQPIGKLTDWERSEVRRANHSQSASRFTNARKPLSASARKRISQAQKARWREVRKAKRMESKGSK